MVSMAELAELNALYDDLHQAEYEGDFDHAREIEASIEKWVQRKEEATDDALAEAMR